MFHSTLIKTVLEVATQVFACTTTSHGRSLPNGSAITLLISELFRRELNPLRVLEVRLDLRVAEPLAPRSTHGHRTSHVRRGDGSAPERAVAHVVRVGQDGEGVAAVAAGVHERVKDRGVGPGDDQRVETWIPEDRINFVIADLELDVDGARRTRRGRR